MIRVLTWPFRILWSFIGVIFLGIGKLLTLLLGLALTITGVVLACTLVGAVVGVPLAIFGVLMMVRSLF